MPWLLLFAPRLCRVFGWVLLAGSASSVEAGVCVDFLGGEEVLGDVYFVSQKVLPTLKAPQM